MCAHISMEHTKVALQATKLKVTKQCFQHVLHVSGR